MHTHTPEEITYAEYAGKHATRPSLRDLKSSDYRSPVCDWDFSLLGTHTRILSPSDLVYIVLSKLVTCTIAGIYS